MTYQDCQVSARPVTEAKRLCAACPEAGTCLADALSRDERDGVWGGWPTVERVHLAAMLRYHVVRIPEPKNGALR